MTDQALLIHGGRVLVLDHDTWDAEAAGYVVKRT